MNNNKRKNKSKSLLIIGVLILLFIALFFRFKDRIIQTKLFIAIDKKLGYKLTRKKIKIPDDVLALSVYDINKGSYLLCEGEKQLPTVASLSKLFVIDYAMTKVNLNDSLEVTKDLLNLVPEGSSLANLKTGKYSAKHIMQAMLVPSGNDAAYALAYNIGKIDLGSGYKAENYVDYFVDNLNKYLKHKDYKNTHLFDPSGFSTQADTNLKDVNRVTLKLLDYDFVKECIGESYFTVKTRQGIYSWKNTNEFLDKDSIYYNKNIKGVKTGTMASSYNLIALYEKNGKSYLITCLAAHTNDGRYKAIETAIDKVIDNN